MFLRDIALPRGGLQEAITLRGGVPKIRCLSARKETDVGVTVEFKNSADATFGWRYSIGIKLEQRGLREPYLTHEKVWRDGEDEPFLVRPNAEDKKDPKRKTQTYLEQVSANAEFREVAEHLQQVQYLHLVPQLIRFPDAFSREKTSRRSVWFGLFGKRCENVFASSAVTSPED